MCEPDVAFYSDLFRPIKMEPLGQMQMCLRDYNFMSDMTVDVAVIE